jgi:voltage-gated potassium channel
VFNRIRFLVALLLLSLVSSCSLFWHFERSVNAHITSFGDVLWWWFISSTTVGYGDIAPVTSMGRIAGVIAVLVGIYSYTNFITITADHLHGMTNQHRLGTARVKCRDHVVICEYTAFADELIQALPAYPELARREVVIVTDLVQTQPYPHHSFVRGVPISPVILERAGIARAAIVFVFANVRYVDPDLKTLHTVSRVRRLNPSARIFVELNNPLHPLALELGADTRILPTQDMLASVLKGKTLDLSAHFSRQS